MTVTKLAILKYDLDQVRAQYRIIDKNLATAYAAYKDAVLKKAGRNITLKKALEVYLGEDRIENAPGYKWLNERTWTGEWMGKGFGFTGEFTPATNQRVLRLWVYEDITPVEIVELSNIVLHAAHALKPHPAEWEGKPDAFAGQRIITIRRTTGGEYDDKGDYHLGLDLRGKRWVLWNTKYKRSKIVAERSYERLRDMLREIRKIAPTSHQERVWK